MRSLLRLIEEFLLLVVL